jgi:hypothetical protein
LDFAKANPREISPLFGFVMVDGHRVAVEYLGEGKDEPNYEALAPDGYHFDCGTHTILGTTQRDLTDQIFGLEKCNKSCNWTGEEADNE